MKEKNFLSSCIPNNQLILNKLGKRFRLASHLQATCHRSFPKKYHSTEINLSKITY